MHQNTDYLSHVFIQAWPVMTSSLTSYGSSNDISQYISLKFVCCIVSWYKNISFHTSMENYANFPLISIDMSFRRAIDAKILLLIFAHTNFVKKYYCISVINSLKVFPVLWLKTMWRIHLTVDKWSRRSFPHVVATILLYQVKKKSAISRRTGS